MLFPPEGYFAHVPALKMATLRQTAEEFFADKQIHTKGIALVHDACRGIHDITRVGNVSFDDAYFPRGHLSQVYACLESRA